MRAESLREVFEEMMKHVGTSVPGHVLSFNKDTQIAQLQIGILGQDVDGKSFKIAPIIECPVQFSGGGGWSFEHELNPKDEGIILFSQRCMDGWIQTGGIANNPISRFHDKQDAMFIPGVRAKPNVIKSFENNGIRLRNESASVYHWLKNDGTIESKNETGSVTISNGSINIISTGNVTINGVTITPTGVATAPISFNAPSVIASTSLTVAGKEMDQHVHSDGTYVAGATDVTGQSGAAV